MARWRWNRVERGCAAVMEVAVIYPFYLAGLFYVLAREDGHRFIDVAFARGQIPVLVAVTAGALGLLALGLFLRTRRPDSLLFQHITANYFGFSLVWAGYVTGTLNFAAGVVLMGAAITGYIVLERRVILAAFVTAFTTVLGLNIATGVGWLPYAPAIVPPTDSSTLLFWIHAAFFLAGPHVLFCLAATAVMVVQWRRREARVLRLSMTDGLTGLHNRRSILDILYRQTARAGEQGSPLAVALVDLDHFKAINDTHGHQVGDRVLVEAARALASKLEQPAAVGRFGGEEFLVVLPGLSREETGRLVEDCRHGLASLEIRSGDGKPVWIRGSFGVAWHGGGAGVDGDALLRAGDAALYRAKELGRDRVESMAPVAGGPGGETGRGSEPLEKARHIRAEAREHLDTGAGPVPGFRGWLRRGIVGIQQWSQEAMTSLMLGLTALQLVGFLGWGLYVLGREDRERLINMAFLPDLIPVMLAVTGLMALLALVALMLDRQGIESGLYLHLTHNIYALTMVGAGYLVGVLSLPTGIILLASPLIGLIFYRPPLVIVSSCTAVAAVIGLAYASAVGWFPYAPLVPESLVHFRVAEPFWVLSYYLFIVPMLLVVLIIADVVLGAWRERGRHIRDLSITDALTRVHNRRNIMNILEGEAGHQRDGDAMLSLVLVDLDEFKAVNDERGHPTGDRVLRQAARVLAANVRDTDAVGRFGGEEFLLVLPRTSLAGALALAERCRAQLEETWIRDDLGREFCVSASFGVSGNESDPTLSVTQLLKSADEALYRAKEQGRNRVQAMAPAGPA